MSHDSHNVYIAASIDAATRIQHLAQKLGCTMADALEVVVDHYDSTVGKEDSDDRDEPTNFVDLSGDDVPSTVFIGSHQGSLEKLGERFVYRQYFRTSRGINLPVGMKLVGSYRSARVEAVVEAGGINFDSKCYPDPSTAAVAVKQSFGTPLSSAQTNGWTFWSYKVGSYLYPLNNFRTSPESAAGTYFASIAKVEQKSSGA